MSSLYEMIDFSEDIPQEFIKIASEETQKSIKDFPLKIPKLNFNENASILITGIPKVNEEKKPKLIQALRKKYNIDQAVIFEINEQGLAVLHFENEDQAGQAADFISKNSNFDAKHKLEVLTQKQIELINATTDYVPINLKPIQELLQFQQEQPTISFIQEKTKLTITQLNSLEKKLNQTIQQDLSQYEKIFWSPLGIYLVLINDSGFSLYGGTQIELLHKFEHTKVKELLFSPDEQYVLSYDGNIEINLWNIREERIVRRFSATSKGLSQFKFNPESKLLAQQSQDEILLFEQPEFYQKLDLVIKAVGVQQIEWVPQTQLLGIVCYGKDVKTQIFLHDFKKKIDIKWRNINFEIDSIQIFPHKYGKWVATVVKKKSKNKVVATTIQVGNLSRTDPFEIDEHTIQEDIENVFYELNTGKFGLAYREKDKQQKPTQQFTFNFYSIQEDQKKGIKLLQIGVQKEKDTNELLWASNGNYFCLVNKTKNSPDQGKIEFGQVLKKNDQLSIDITKSTNHFYMSNAQWDPSGIYFVTMSDLWHSVNVWSAIGEQLIKDTITKITDIRWRNKPIHLLTYQEEQELQNNTKNFSKKYEIEDDKITNKAKYDKEQKRKDMKDNFTNYLNEKKKIYNNTKNERIKLLGYDEEDKSKLVSLKKIIKEEVVKQQ